MPRLSAATRCWQCTVSDGRLMMQTSEEHLVKSRRVSSGRRCDPRDTRMVARHRAVSTYLLLIVIQIWGDGDGRLWKAYQRREARRWTGDRWRSVDTEAGWGSCVLPLVRLSACLALILYALFPAPVPCIRVFPLARSFPAPPFVPHPHLRPFPVCFERVFCWRYLFGEHCECKRKHIAEGLLGVFLLYTLFP